MNTTTATVIRVADKSDIDVIRRLAHAVWPEAYQNILSPAQLNYMLELFYSPQSLEKQFNEKHVFLLAFMNAENVGFASYSHGHEAGVYKIHKLYVLPLLHGKGYGNALLQRITSDVRKLGGRALRLNVNRSNRAKAFYERNGFRVIGEEDIAIGEGYFMNDYVMEKEI